MSSNVPLVSIIINCFNGEKYLASALESVLNQSYSNWEVIFWDNMSTDHSAKIFKNYQKTDTRFKYFLGSSHTTLYCARNLAIQKSTGEFIAFLDVDDYWLPNKLEIQMPFFRDDSVGLVYGNFVWKNTIKSKEYIAHVKLLPSGSILGELLKSYDVGLLTIVIRRAAFAKCEVSFNPSYNIIGDFDMVIKLSEKWNFQVVQTPVAVCRWHGENLQELESEKQVAELLKWLNSIDVGSLIAKTPEFKILKNDIHRMKLVKEALDKNYSYIIKNISHIKGLKNILKLVISIILPRKMYLKISSR